MLRENLFPGNHFLAPEKQRRQSFFFTEIGGKRCLKQLITYKLDYQ